MGMEEVRGGRGGEEGYFDFVEEVGEGDFLRTTVVGLLLVFEEEPEEGRGGVKSRGVSREVAEVDATEETEVNDDLEKGVGAWK